MRPSVPLAATLGSLALLLAWDAGGGDLWLAQQSGTPAGFPLRDAFWLASAMHRGGKTLSWALVLGLLAMVRWPVGLFRELARAERWQLVLGTLAAVGAVTLLKHASHTSCPWDLRAFGGTAAHVSHWAWGVRDGGPGHCFPAGHASAAFAFVGGWFALRRRAPRAAACWLGAALAAGLAFGIGQQLRGAHFLSHTLWSGWVCWTVGWAVDALVRATVRRQDAKRDTKLNAV